MSSSVGILTFPRYRKSWNSMVPKHQPEYHGFMVYQWFHDHQKLESSLVSIEKAMEKTPVFMGKSTIHAHFVCLPEGKSHEITIFPMDVPRNFFTAHPFPRLQRLLRFSPLLRMLWRIQPPAAETRPSFCCSAKENAEFCREIRSFTMFSVEFRIQQVKFWWFTKKIRG